jgi:hypothetical protein
MLNVVKLAATGIGASYRVARKARPCSAEGEGGAGVALQKLFFEPEKVDFIEMHNAYILVVKMQN